MKLKRLIIIALTGALSLAVHANIYARELTVGRTLAYCQSQCDAYCRSLNWLSAKERNGAIHEKSVAIPSDQGKCNCRARTQQYPQGISTTAFYFCYLIDNTPNPNPYSHIKPLR